MSNNELSRRDFIKTMATASAATTGITACTNKENSTSSGEIPTGQMTYRPHPKTGKKISLLGYGCMRWPTRPRKDGSGEEIDQEAVNGLIDFAIAHGVNYFDTAPNYVQNLSEEATGIALHRHPRHKWHIATKISNFTPDTETFEGATRMYRESFRRLQVDYIDYLLLHGIGMGGMDVLGKRFLRNGVLDFLLKEREAGRIRNLGFSFHGDVEVFDYMLSRHNELKWDFVQIQLNYVDWQHAAKANVGNPWVRNVVNAEYLYNRLAELHIPCTLRFRPTFVRLAPRLAELHIPCTIMEPLLGGRLSKVPNHIVAQLKQREPEQSVASWAFRYAGSFPNVLTVLSGMTYMEHLQDNLRTFCPLRPLTEEERQFLYHTAKLLMQYPTIPCNDCKYCMPCPFGVNIPAIFTHYNKCINEGNVAEAQDENYREARRAFLIGYDRSVPKLRQANHCIGCKRCMAHCPLGINIPGEMHRIDAYVERLKQDISAISS